MKLLIVEDEPELAQSMVTYLKGENYLCETAPTAAIAQEKMEQFDYDCILLDISLPDGNGLALLEELKRNNKTDGVIIISPKNAIDDRIKGLNLVDAFNASDDVGIGLMRRVRLMEPRS